ncbi:MAG TPA: AAA family ATPase [Candidatus Saccharimonadales bacterium]|nr:AAA family ATPase [Candidatus Saccharimonadales bacterium]
MFFCCDSYIFAQKNNEKKLEKTAGQCFLYNHPLLCSAVAMSAIGTYLYSDFIKEHPHEFFLGSLATIAWMYYKKEQIFSDANHADLNNVLQETGNSYSDDYALFAQCGCRIYYPGEILTQFKDVAGLDTAKEDVSDIVMFLKNQKKFIDIGAQVPKGILLSGAPGNGKTLLARALAGEAQCPFLYINGSEFVESVVGVGSARIRHLFAIAKALAPCIIFIDEIDAIGQKRSFQGATSDSEFAQTLNQLLAEMDGFEQQKDPIIVIGATNRADVLDHALLRPGRFDRKIEIHAPFIKDRFKILTLHLKKIKAAKNIDVYTLACGTPGFSGAQLKQLVNEAAILAVREGKTIVTMDHFDQARDYMLLGRERKGMELSKKELWQTAVHEAGHALACVFQKNSMPLYKVTIVPRGPALAVTYTMDQEHYYYSQDEMKAEIVMLLGGSVAEEIMFAGRGSGALSDLQKARELATDMVMSYGMTDEFKDVTFSEFIHNQAHLPADIATSLHKAVAKVIEECRTIAWHIIVDHKIELEQLIELLLKNNTISGRDVYTLCGVEQPDITYCLNE